MRLTNVYEAADALAPFRLSREYCETYNFHDNSGIILDCGEDVTGVLCSLDLSHRAVDEAKKVGANVIFTHHPAIFYPVSSLKADDPVLRCARAGISVISAHLNLDAAPGGIDEELMLGLGGRSCEIMHTLSEGGYGRVYGVEAPSLSGFVGGIGARVASFCGAGLDDASVAFAIGRGADTVVSADGKHHLIAALAEAGVNVVLMTHYASENYGFVRFADNLKQKIKGTPVHVFTDERLM